MFRIILPPYYEPSILSECYLPRVYTFLLSVVIGCELVATQDASICSLQTKNGPPPPPPSLKPSYSTTIEWKDLNTNSTMIVKEYFNGIKNIGCQDIYTDQRYTKIVYDNIQNQYLQYTQDEGCTVKDLGSFTYFEDKLWISAFNELYGVITKTIPGFQGVTTVRNMTVNHWKTCLYIVGSDITALINFYFTVNWEMAQSSPQGFVPVRFDILGSGKEVNGTRPTFHVIGDFVNFNSAPDLEELQTHMQLPAGVYCDGRLSSKPLNPFATEFSVLFEIVDNVKHTITYEQIWYNNVKKLIRRDYKESDSTDPDSTLEIFDFSLGNHYTMKPDAGSCDPVELLQLGDNYVLPNGNGTIRMISALEFFHLKYSQTQYVGYRTTRGVLCDVWVGTYVDRDNNANRTIEWYFNNKYSEAVGGAISYSSLMRMDIWEVGSKEPVVRNVLKLDTEAPTQDVFSVGLCYKRQRVRVIIHLRVVNGTIGIVSDSFLMDALQVKILELADLPPLRMADVMLSRVGDTDLYLDGSLLEKPPAINDKIVPKPQSQHELFTAYNFLKVTLNNQPLIEVWNFTKPPIVVQALGIETLDYKSEFSTTRRTPSTPLRTPPTPELIPTTIRPETPTTYPTPNIQAPSSPGPTGKPSCTCPSRECPPTTPPKCPTPQPSTKCFCPIVSCPNAPTQKCPTPAPCPVVPSCATSKPCVPKACPQNTACTPCPPCGAGVTTKCPVITPALFTTATTVSASTGTTNKSGGQQQQAGDGSSGSGISSGGAVGLAFSMVIVGFVLGVVLLRVFQRFRRNKDSEEQNFFSKYLTDDANY